jgi:acyl-lipid omega-6 desaturase (Delta-12 desaturase)
MRSGRELILASKDFIHEDRKRSWIETIITLAGLITFLTVAFLELPLVIRIACGFVCALFYVRMFIIYHDYQHHALLQGSPTATLIMKAFGIFILAPQTIWKRSHDHHHTHNSKLTIHGIGSYPTITKKHYLKLSKTQRRIYLLNRHPLTVIFGYLTLFIYWLNVKSFFQSPRKHTDSLLALIIHIGASILIYQYFGATTYFVSWFAPFFIAFAMGSYLFYCQHNFPGAIFSEHHDWKYDAAAIESTSFMKMNPILQWFTGNIGFHHVHHLNSRIPFYRLPEAMQAIPEMHNPITTSWNPIEMWRCFRLKLWDAEQRKMITLSQLNNF